MNGRDVGLPHRDHDHRFFNRFFHSEVSGSIVLLAFTVLALVLANSPWADRFFAFANSYVGVTWGDAEFKMSVAHWVADGLMAIFFFVVGLEIKREFVLGQLSTRRQATLPVLAALGGAIVPATVYTIFNVGPGGVPSGWGVPMATDIAFALGLLAVFGSRVPIGLKVFLTALAIADDLIAVMVIAVFYTDRVVVGGLVVAAAAMVGIAVLKQMQIRRLGPYIVLCVVTWAGVLASGVHATIAGVALALLVSVRSSVQPEAFLDSVKTSLRKLEESDELTRESPVHANEHMEALDALYVATAKMRPVGLAFEHYLHPVQAFLILPLFALFMTGVPISVESLAGLAGPTSLGIIFGLVLGKQLGIMAFAVLAVRFAGSELPQGVTWKMMWGVSSLGGVGFTMAIFVSELAYDDPVVIGEAKLAILAASAFAAIIGFIVLSRAMPANEEIRAVSAT